MFLRCRSVEVCPSRRSALCAALCLAWLTAVAAAAEDGLFTVEHAAKLRVVTEARISPSGELVAYVLRVPREPYAEGDGPARLSPGGPAEALHLRLS